MHYHTLNRLSQVDIIKQMCDDSIVYHLPHASLLIPSDDRRSFLVDDQELDFINKTTTDLYTDEFFATLIDDNVVIKAEYSRLLVDVERFVDDDKEKMSEVGMGVVYFKDYKGNLIRKIDDVWRQKLIEQYYLPHHQQLYSAVGASLMNNGHCLILDLHSFASNPLACDGDQAKNRPDICLGYDDFHAPIELVNEIQRGLESVGLTVKRNQPFAGSIVPMEFYQKDNKVKSLMIEINKRIYMDEVTFSKKQQFDKMSKLVCDIAKHALQSVQLV